MIRTKDCNDEKSRSLGRKTKSKFARTARANYGHIPLTQHFVTVRIHEDSREKSHEIHSFGHKIVHHDVGGTYGMFSVDNQLVVIQIFTRFSVHLFAKASQAFENSVPK